MAYPTWLLCILAVAASLWVRDALARPDAARLVVSVVDDSGQGLQHAVVSLHGETPMPAEGKPVAIMDQRQLQFAPTVLAVQAGTVVEFPNQDDVRHHVYSFSHPNAFELKLYHGQSGNYNQFDHPGVVVLGCNIHDGMLGYLRVVDTPLYGTSDIKGAVSIDPIAAGEYQLEIWHPDLGMRIIRQSITLKEGDNTLTIPLDLAGVAAPARKPVHKLQALFRD